MLNVPYSTGQAKAAESDRHGLLPSCDRAKDIWDHALSYRKFQLRFPQTQVARLGEG